MIRVRAVPGLLLAFFSICLTVPGMGRTVDAGLHESAGAVFSMTNAADGNEIVMFHRDARGLLTPAGRYPTGGLGTGGQFTPIDPLASQNSLILTHNRRSLLAVNAGSDEVSLFRVRDDGLVLADTIHSGGHFPVSLAQRGRLLYVLNAGGEGNITGFRIGRDGLLHPLAGSTRSLELGGTQPPNIGISPAQIEFTPRGDMLVVAVKGTREIRVFHVDDTGRPSQTAVSNFSAGSFPFGFGFDREGRLLVTEVGTGSVSSYSIREDGSLLVLSARVPTFQFATCWIDEIAGKFAYVTNTLSHNLTGFRVRRDGTLLRLNSDGIALQLPSPVAYPTDMAAAADRFLYTLNPGDGTVSMIRVEPDGRLTLLGEVPALPPLAGAQGIAAY